VVKRPPTARYRIELVGLTMEEVCNLAYCMERAQKVFGPFEGRPTRNIVRQVQAQKDEQFGAWFKARLDARQSK
jgi:hypothetical protein